MCYNIEDERLSSEYIPVFYCWLFRFAGKAGWWCDTVLLPSKERISEYALLYKMGLGYPIQRIKTDWIGAYNGPFPFSCSPNIIRYFVQRWNRDFVWIKNNCRSRISCRFESMPPWYSCIWTTSTCNAYWKSKTSMDDWRSGQFWRTCSVMI